MVSLFEPYKIKNMQLKNRIVMSPMCQYKAMDDNGIPNNWHFVHYVSRAVGGTGLVMTEMTNVEPRGRITNNCLGIYNDEQEESFKHLNEEMHRYGAKSGIQIAHAGRKSVIKGGDIVAPSAIPFSDDSPVPRELQKEEIERIVEEFAKGTRRAVRAGFDTIEIHGAHGYLIHQFLSPASNKRTDEYGDPLVFPLEVIKAIKSEMPGDMPLIMRVSAVEYGEGGYGFRDMMSFCPSFIQAGVDMFDVSTGGDAPKKPEVYPGYQTKYGADIHEQLAIPVISVGKLETPEVAEFVIKEKMADLVCIGKGMLRQPYWAKEAAEKLHAELRLPGVYDMGY